MPQPIKALLPRLLDKLTSQDPNEHWFYCGPVSPVTAGWYRKNKQGCSHRQTAKGMVRTEETARVVIPAVSLHNHKLSLAKALFIDQRGAELGITVFDEFNVQGCSVSRMTHETHPGQDLPATRIACCNPFHAIFLPDQFRPGSPQTAITIASPKTITPTQATQTITPPLPSLPSSLATLSPEALQTIRSALLILEGLFAPPITPITPPPPQSLQVEARDPFQASLEQLTSQMIEWFNDRSHDDSNPNLFAYVFQDSSPSDFQKGIDAVLKTDVLTPRWRKHLNTLQEVTS